MKTRSDICMGNVHRFSNGDFRKYSTILVTSLFTAELCSVDRNHSQQYTCIYNTDRYDKYIIGIPFKVPIQNAFMVQLVSCFEWG